MLPFVTLCSLVFPFVTLWYPVFPRVTLCYSGLPCVSLWFVVLGCGTLDYPVLLCVTLCYHLSPVFPWILLCYPVFVCVTLFNAVLCINQRLPLRAHHWASIGTQGHLSQLTDICCLRVWRKMLLLFIEIAPQGADIGDLLVSVIPY